MKDDEDDCDLDPELSVADLLVDEGKAAKDGADQKRVVKVIQEQGRAIRQGSVVPDLTPIHYQPPARPPVPRFADGEKRRTDQVQTDERPNKRRRLDQIEEETNEILNSIEPDGERATPYFELPGAHFLSAVNGSTNDLGPTAEIKQESPELVSSWVNTGPATRDELELLPEAPPHFQSRPRANQIDTRRRQEAGIEIRESSAVPDDTEERAQDLGIPRDDTVDRSVRQRSDANAVVPITPPNAENALSTSDGRAVSMLNTVKSNSPMLRQTTSTSANRFRKPVRNLYDYPESDIDDTQMSPRSRASRSVITPKLAPAPHPRNIDNVVAKASKKDVETAAGTRISDVWRTETQDDAMDADGDKENHLPHSKRDGLSSYHENVAENSSNMNSNQSPETGPRLSRGVGGVSDVDRSSILGSDETWILHENGTKVKSKRTRLHGSKRNQTGDDSASRNSSVVSSTRGSSSIAASDHRTLKRKRVAPARISDVQSRDEISELDSPGVQLSETLRQSSPMARRSKESKDSPAEQVPRSGTVHEPRNSQTVGVDSTNDDIERPPASGSDSEDDIPPLKTPKHRPRIANPSSAVSRDGLRCFTCWSKRRACDNAQPKCRTCLRESKNCQIYSMTQAEAEDEKAKRLTQKNANKMKKSAQGSSKPKSQPSEVVVSASDGDDEVDDDKIETTEKSTSRDSSLESKVHNGTSKIHVSSESETVSDGNRNPQTSGKPRTPEATPVKRRAMKTKSPKQQRLPEDEPSSGRKEIEAKVSGSKITTKGVAAKAGSSRSQPQGIAKPKTQGSETSPPNMSTGREKRVNDGKTDRKRHTDANGIEASPATEKTAEPVSTVQSDKRPASVENVATRERSIEGQATNNSKILPPGMTQEEYDSLIGSRAHLTEEQRNRKKQLTRKLGKQKESSPVLVRASQDVNERPKQETSHSKVSVQVPSMSQVSSKSREKPPSSQPASVTPSSAAASQPNSAPVTSRSGGPRAKKSSQTELGPQPVANTSSKMKTHNPPFRGQMPTSQPQAQHKSVVPFSGLSTASPSLTTTRSLKDVRAVLKLQSRSGSGTSSPQPGFTPAARVAQMRRDANKKKVFSLSDEDEDDEDSESDEETEDSNADDEKKAAGTVKTSVNPRSQGRVTVRRRSLSESESDSEEDEEDDSDGEA